MSPVLLITILQLGLLFFHLLAWCAVVHILLTKRDPRSAFGWTAVLLLVPVLGLFLYVLFGISRTQSRAAAIMRRHAALLPSYAHPQLADIPPSLPVFLTHMEHLGRSLTRQHLSPGNSIEPLFNGNEAYPCMLEAIEQAQEHVLLVTYIFNDGRIARRFCDALIAAARRGVDVRVLVDGVGRFYTLNSPLGRLAGHGVRVATFLPPSLVPPNLMINLRNHRKILVCDDVGFTGGMNIADYHVVETGEKNAAQDIQFHCTGPVVLELYRAFLLDWGVATQQYDKMLPVLRPRQHGSCFCRIVLDGPGTGSDPLNDLIAGSISNAVSSVTIMTPYFLPTREIMAVLRIAAEKGVQVRIILPAKNNLIYVHWASLRVMPDLLQSGVRIFFQPPPFAHTKLLCIDNYYCQIGSANYDSRSLRLNFELNTEVFDMDFNTKMTTFCESVLAKSRELHLSELENMSLPAKLRSAIFWLFSPYL